MRTSTLIPSAVFGFLAGMAGASIVSVLVLAIGGGKGVPSKSNASDGLMEVENGLAIVDHEGRRRAMLSVEHGLSLLDEEGTPRAVLTLQDSWAGLALYDSRGNRRTTLVVDEDAGTAFWIRDENGTSSLVASQDDDTGTVLTLLGPDGEGRIILAVPTKMPRTFIKVENSKATSSVWIGTNGSAGVMVTDPENSRSFEASPSTKE